MVERWEIDRPMNWQAMMVQADDGKFVLASDYDQLVVQTGEHNASLIAAEMRHQASLDALEKEVERLEQDVRDEGDTVSRCRRDNEPELALLASERVILLRTIVKSFKQLIKEHGGGGSGSEKCEECEGRREIVTGECAVAMSGPTCMNPECPPCQTPETEPCPSCGTRAEGS